jgi:ATP-dependent helicase/nuclease subunit B
MAADAPRLFTIPPDRPFLESLARAVLGGFPCADPKPPGSLGLGGWTILLPTRRAVRELEEIFFRLTGASGVLLPSIRPLGDVDEDLLAPGQGGGDLGTPVTAPGQHLLLMELIDEWARAHPATRLAREIAAAPHQVGGLASSLAEFLDAIETEDIDLARLPELYSLESARHREAILEFLAIAREKYPQRLMAEKAIGPQARRSAVLRREARRLDFTRTQRPFIAAGSTGSIPATCELLKAIAGLPNGAVVLPGLDQEMDEASWTALGPTHPQHGLKQLLARLNASRQTVETLGAAAGPRSWLAGEIMRPAETAHLWHAALKAKEALVAAAMADVELVETRSLQEEAMAAALMLRECLETPGRTGCLITPDRQLARRVKAELGRWNITIDDSAGEPLVRHAGASLLNLLLEGLLQGFVAEPLAALLRHDLALFGLAPEEARHHTSLIEIALLRTGTGAPEIGRLAHALRLAAEEQKTRPSHLLLRAVTAEQWESTIAHAGMVAGVLEPLLASPPRTLAAHLDRLAAACEAIAGEAFWRGEGGEVLADAISLLRAESRLLSDCDLPRAAAIIRHWLHAIPVRSRRRNTAPLAILGLLEARLMRADVTVLAGLNEGVWPGPADSGPWINRPMRELLGMKQPESQIGQTAHDFVQAFGNSCVKLLWSRRIGDSPATPSRWILRLQMILETAGLTGRFPGTRWLMMARRLAEPAAVTPIGVPKPRPPVKLRPRALSVTRIEKLVRDPYAIYARHVLWLEPLKPVATTPDPARRGIIFHGAIGDFLTAYPEALPADVAKQLEDFGSRHFQQIADYPGLVSFWWPRFRRIAQWIAQTEPQMRDGVARVIAEQMGAIDLAIAGDTFRLSCRADRIDLLADGGARILDYKTGAVPSKKQVESGLSPQLTLQAAILARGGFRDVEARRTDKINYVHITGGDPAGEVEPIKIDVMDVAEKHLAELEKLLTAYALQSQPYLPRTGMEREDDEGDYDHLSRLREWALSGGAR